MMVFIHNAMYIILTFYFLYLCNLFICIGFPIFSQEIHPFHAFCFTLYDQVQHASLTICAAMGNFIKFKAQWAPDSCLYLFLLFFVILFYCLQIMKFWVNINCFLEIYFLFFTVCSECKKLTFLNLNSGIMKNDLQKLNLGVNFYTVPDCSGI